MSGESVAAIAKDMRVRQLSQSLAEFSAIQCETAVLHPKEAAVKLPRPFVEVSAVQGRSTLATQRVAV